MRGETGQDLGCFRSASVNAKLLVLLGGVRGGGRAGCVPLALLEDVINSEVTTSLELGAATAAGPVESDML